MNTNPMPFLIGSIDFSLLDYKRLISIDETFPTIHATELLAATFRELAQKLQVPRA